MGFLFTLNKGHTHMGLNGGVFYCVICYSSQQKAGVDAK